MLSSAKPAVLILALATFASLDAAEQSKETPKGVPEAPEVEADASGKELFETHCGVCHTLALPRSQRLDRKTWGWVVDDMVNQFGAVWITEEQQKKIIDYLAENYGPDRPREGG